MSNNLGENNSEPRGQGRVFGVPRRRQEIVKLLSEAYAQDFLEQVEFERRLERAEQAQTIEELEAIIADFPAGVIEGHPARDPAAGPAAETAADLERQVEILDGQDAPTRFSLLGDQHATVLPTDPQVLRSVAVIGDARVDLRGLAGTSGAFLLKIAALIGDTKIIVPRGTRVHTRLISVIGGQRRTRRSGDLLSRLARKIGVAPENKELPQNLPTPTVVVTGFKLMGDIIVVED